MKILVETTLWMWSPRNQTMFFHYFAVEFISLYFPFPMVRIELSAEEREVVLELGNGDFGV